LNCLDRFSKKYSNIKFYKHPFSGSRVVLNARTEGRTSRQDETNSRFSKFYEGTKQKTNSIALGGIRNRDPSSSAAADLRLRLNGHRIGTWFYLL
jgi:hypothetical protein